ncbi:MAG: hypothetical protein GTO18_15370 [Anaerolineales bacterium]|nr:hypothetical protein [Anaerolineales bacterium]
MRQIKSKTKLATMDWTKFNQRMVPYFLVSPDQRRLAAVMKEDDWNYVQVNDERQNVYELLFGMMFSPDSRRIAYFAMEESGKIITIVDDENFGSYMMVMPESLEFSPDSRQFAYTVKSHDGSCVVIDGEEQQTYKGILEYDTIFNPGREGYAYGAYDGEQWHVITDQGRQGPFEALGKLIFSPGGERLGYKARINGKEALILDGEQQKPYDHVDNPHFNRDGSFYAYAARDGNQWVAVVNGVEQGRYDDLGLTDRSISDVGDHLVYCAKKAGQAYLVADGLELGPYPDVLMDSVTLSPDGNRLAFATKTGAKGFLGLLPKKEFHMIIDGEPGEVFNDLALVLFSPDSSRYLYLAKRGGKEVLVIDGVVHGPFEGQIGIGEKSFSPDSSRVMYAIYAKNELYICVDDQRFGPYKSADEFTFSPDGSHFAYPALVEGRQSVVLDGEEGETFDNIVVLGGGKVVFDSAKEFHYIATQGMDWYRVEEVIT